MAHGSDDPRLPHMMLSAHQPAYLPWLGYLDKIASSDVFVFLDDVQFEKSSFINRNRIKTLQGAQWLTVPVRMKGHMNATLLDIGMDNSQPWRRKHLAAVALNYRKARFFDYAYPRLEALLGAATQNLADFCWEQLRFWMVEFGIATRLVRQSQTPVEGTKSELVLNLCRQQGADAYLSGRLGRDYLDLASFEAHGIEVRFQHFNPQPYPQLWGAFEPGLSVLDYWMNCGPGKLAPCGDCDVL